MCTMTWVSALAVPLNFGVWSRDGEGGCSSVTLGDSVLTMNFTALLVPGSLPSELGCVATALYSPSANCGLAAFDSQAPPAPEGAELATSVPSGLGPA